MNREGIYTALFALVSGSYAFKTKSRRLKHWGDVGPAEQPALFQVQGDQSYQYAGRGIPAKTVLKAEFYVYARSGGTPDSTPSSAINPLLDAIDAALAPPTGMDVQTLGGLVSHCWIAGTIKTDEGALGDQAVSIIPVEILVNV